jgi:hypothetical protein
MASRDQIIEKIKVLSEERLKEVADFLDLMEEKNRTKPRVKKDLLSKAIGSCVCPTDLAEKRDKYAYE